MGTRRHTLIGRFVDVPPDPLRLARRLVGSGLDGVAVLYDATPGPERGVAYLAAMPDAVSEALDPAAQDPVAAVGRFGQLPRWIGVIPYEARRDLERAAWCQQDQRAAPIITRPRWRRYPAVARVDHRTGHVLVVGSSHAAAQLAEALRCHEHDTPRDCAIDVIPAHPSARHVARIEHAIELIRAGDLYQVNLARRLDVSLRQGRPIDVFARLCRASCASYAAYLELSPSIRVLSTSPELLLDARASSRPPHSFRRLVTEPIKGTRPRGSDAQSDLALAAELDADPKERAELAMIVDVERNDLGRIAETGSVRVVRSGHVVSHGTVHHRKARLTACARRDASRSEVLASMVPSGSVTGAPKVRAMEVIRQLEAERRGLYTGAIGYLAHDGSMRLSMAIRTMVLSGTRGHYWTGGGIVVRSDPQRELDETNWKAAQLAGL
jgi:anthranilate/para-aminobenzoate synthase component I